MTKRQRPRQPQRKTAQRAGVLRTQLSRMALAAVVLAMVGGSWLALSSSAQDEQPQQLQQQTESWKHFLTTMFAKVDAHAASLNGVPDLPAQELYIMSEWLSSVGMDPSVYRRRPITGGNWMYDLYQRTRTMAPASSFFRVWDERSRPTPEQVAILTRLDDQAVQEAQVILEDGSVELDEDTLMGLLFVPFRHRGFYPTLLDTFSRVLVAALKSVAFCIPSPDNLRLLERYQPLVEMGAGSGYWTAVLQQGGVDILAYDAHPPKTGGDYFDHTYATVHAGDCDSVFTNDNKDVMKNRTLLLIWPNNPDNVDNDPEFHSPRLPRVWDHKCVDAFVNMGGTTVVLVAEREVNIHVLPYTHERTPTRADSGLCASRELQQRLLRDFDLVEQQDVPSWYFADDLTVWRIKQDRRLDKTADESPTTTIQEEL